MGTRQGSMLKKHHQISQLKTILIGILTLTLARMEGRSSRAVVDDSSSKASGMSSKPRIPLPISLNKATFKKNPKNIFHNYKYLHQRNIQRHYLFIVKQSIVVIMILIIIKTTVKFQIVLNNNCKL